MTPLDANGSKADTWYHATATHPGPFEQLNGSRSADVAIIGGGFTGLSAALALAEAGLDVTLIEARQIGFGASGRNGGQVGSGQRVDQMALEAQYGTDLALALWDIAEAAKAEVRRLIETHEIEAGWQDGIANVARKPKTMAYLTQYAEHLRGTYKYDAEILTRDEAAELVGSEDVHGGLLDPKAGHIHPLRFLYGLAKAANTSGVKIFENTRASSVAKGCISTPSGSVLAKNILIATNGYTGQLQTDVASRVLPINSFVGVTEPLEQSVLRRNIAVADDLFVVNYWRMVEGNRLLFGGGESYGIAFPRDIATKVRKPMIALYPALKDVRIDYAWGGTLAITTTRNPLFREVEPGVFTASGYSGHGIAMGTLGGRIAAEAILGDRTRFDQMARLDAPPVPGGRLVRRALIPLAMQFYAIRDRIGL